MAVHRSMLRNDIIEVTCSGSTSWTSDFGEPLWLPWWLTL